MDDAEIDDAVRAVRRADLAVDRAIERARELQRHAGDRRALAIARLVDVAGRDGAARLLGVSVKAIDKATTRARGMQMGPTIQKIGPETIAMRKALIEAAAETGLWRVEQEWGTISRHYDADGNDITDHYDADGAYIRAARVDMGAYCYGVSSPELRAHAPRAFVEDGQADDPAEAVRLLLAEPVPRTD